MKMHSSIKMYYTQSAEPYILEALHITIHEDGYLFMNGEYLKSRTGEKILPQEIAAIRKPYFYKEHELFHLIGDM